MFRLNGRWVHSPDEITDDERVHYEQLFRRPMTKQYIFDKMEWAAWYNHQCQVAADIASYAA